MSPQDAAAFAAARQICRTRARDEYLATLLLPRGKRDGVCAIYAFYRMAQDAIGSAPAEEPTPASAGDGYCSGGSLESRVSMVRERLDAVYDGRLELPRSEFRDTTQHALNAFSKTVDACGIPKTYFVELIGALAEARRVRRYATWNALQQHCRRSGGMLALAFGGALGLMSSGAAEPAVRLGSAIRLSCVLRDLRRDWAAGQLYLPLEDMARLRYSERDLTGNVLNSHFADLIRFEVSRARALYQEGSECICWLAGDGSRLAVSSVVTMYSGVLDEIERRRFNVLQPLPGLTGARKLRRFPLAWRLARRRHDERLPRLFRN